MMRRHARRRRRAAWQYADSTHLEVTNGAPTSYVWIMPPARAQFLAQARNRDSITFAGAHLWLDFWWVNKASATGIPDVDLGVVKTTIGDPISFAPDLSLVQGQWDQPATPAALTSWAEDDDDGTDSWLWSHHIKGSTPPNAAVVTQGTPPQFNQYLMIGTGTVDSPSIMCRKFCVTQEWQPDVVIRSKRRLQKDEGILLYMNCDSAAANLFVNLDVRLRTLMM